MTPTPQAALGNSAPSPGELLRTLAAAPSWAALCAEIERAIATLLPSTRLDIYAAMPDGTDIRRFTTERARQAEHALVDCEVQLRYQLQIEGYSAIMIVPLHAVGYRRGWLALARRAGRLTPLAQSLVEQSAPVIALWLHSEQQDHDLAASAERAAMLEQRVRSTDSLHLRSLLLAGAAHDIGNLFTTIMGYAQILQQDLPHEFQDDIRMIIRAVEDGRQLLRRLSGHEPMPTHSHGPVSGTSPIIQEVVKLTRPLWERRGIHVELALEGSPAVRMPAQSLREVLVNLIMNAVAAVNERGTITVRSHVVAGHAIVSVSDTGQGIAREHQGMIFQPFVTTRVDGSGLGLSVSRTLVERHDGTLTVESELGQGATFTISLPLAHQ